MVAKRQNIDFSRFYGAHKQILAVEIVLVARIARQSFQVVGLSLVNGSKVCYFFVLFAPKLYFLFAHTRFRSFQLSSNGSSDPLGLDHEHGDRVVLVLHAHVKQLLVATLLIFGRGVPLDPAVQVRQKVGVFALELETFRQKRKVVLVACAQNYRVKSFPRTVDESASVCVDLAHNRRQPYFFGPLELADGASGVSHGYGDFFRAKFQALLGNVAGAPTRPHHQDVLTSELVGASEIVRVEDPASEGVHAFEIWQVWRGKVPGCDNQIIESACGHFSPQ